MRWLVLGVLLVGAPAWGQSDEDVRPAAVSAKLDGITARMTAKFQIPVTAGIGFGLTSITVPPGGMVTSAAAIVRGVRHPLRLEEADVASKRLDAIAHKPLTNHPAWAIMLGGSSTSIQLDVLAPIDTTIGLEITMDVPTCFFHAARYVLVDEAWRARLPAALRVEDVDGLTEACAPHGVEGREWIRFASAHLERKDHIGTLAGRLALPAADIARFEVDLGSRLADVPRDLHTAIIIDHSRSMTPDELEAQRAVVAAYLNAAPTSRVQVIAYTRRAEALLPTWMIASQAAPRLDRAIRALSPSNGSNIDVALAEAATWLARAHGTKRILLFTDERISDRFGPDPVATLRRVTPAGTLVHVVMPGTGDGTPMRSDEALLAGLAKATEGIAINASVGEKGEVDATMLLRPVSLDNVAITAAGWEMFERDEERTCQDLVALAAGMSCTWWGKGTADAGPITVEGMLWNHRFVRTLRPDPSQALTLARVLSNDGALEPPLQDQIHRAALAVNSVWSLFTVWGGDGGYEEVGGGGSFGVGSFSTRSHDIGHGTGTGTAVTLDVRWQLDGAIKRCRRDAARIDVTLELTREEIVDVSVDAANSAVRNCVVEAMWETTLVVSNAPFHAFVHERF